MEINNAKITSTQLGAEDHGIPTCWLHLEYDGSAQGFGGYDLRYYGISMITRILEVLEVESWEKLRGTYVRIKGDSGKIHAIGHITKNQWYNPQEEDKKKKK